MKKIFVLTAAVLALTGCGAWDRSVAQVTGVAESCHAGVVYLQFTSGVTVKYSQDGKVVTCK